MESLTRATHDQKSPETHSLKRTSIKDMRTKRKQIYGFLVIIVDNNTF